MLRRWRVGDPKAECALSWISFSVPPAHARARAAAQLSLEGCPATTRTTFDASKRLICPETRSIS